MKNLFFSSLITLVCASPLKTTAQSYFNFQNNTTIVTEAKPQETQNLAPIKYAVPQPEKKNILERNLSSITESCKKFQFKFAQILNREVEQISNTVLFGFINDWWATRYRYGGTGKNGIDCSAYTGMLINRVYAYKLPRTAREQWASTERVKLESMKEGDLVFFNTTGGVSHVGVYLGNGYFTHSSSSQGVTINNLADNYWKARFLGGGRFRADSDKAVDALKKLFFKS